MFVKKFLLLIAFLFLFCNLASAAIFTVTSNADSGTGTLREALTLAAANGSAVKDFIYFNIADQSVAGRTIIITSQLPDVSSNLVIDGSTQPGLKFGVSDAKVAIKIGMGLGGSPVIFNAINQTDIEFYGLLLNNPVFTNATGIDLSAVKNATIGAAGKGNVINGYCSLVVHGLGNPSDNGELNSENIKISGNILGLYDDGETLPPDPHNFSITLARIKNLTFGGLTKAEGNLVSGPVYVLDTPSFPNDDSTGDLLIMNNLFGVDYTGTKAIPYFFNELNVTGLKRTSFVIKNNVITAGKFSISSNCFFEIKGNLIGTDITGTKVLGNVSAGLVVSYSYAGGIIGGDEPADRNIIAGSYSGENDFKGSIRNSQSQNIELLGNVFKCNLSEVPYEMIDGSANIVRITSRSASAIRGTCSPFSRVDLYYTLECDHCEPQQLFASVTADASGQWVYTGILAAKPITVAATLNGATSEFSRSGFDTHNLKITHVCKGGLGSIKGLTLYGGNVKWIDENNNDLGSNPDLLNLLPGKYTLSVGFGCPVKITFEIFEDKTIINPDNKQLTNAGCGQPNGSITGMLVQISPAGVPEFVWRDQNAQKVGSGEADLNNVGAGQYTLTVTSVSGCVDTYGPFDIINTVGPSIDQSSYTRLPSSCTIANGYIHGITATGTNVKYSWKNERQVEVGTSADLDGQPAGKYTLTVTDESQCGPVTSSEIEIGFISDISINTAPKNVQDANCDNSDGAITNVQVTGTGTYLWTNEQGTDVGHNINLTGVPAGRYKLTVSSASCQPVSTAFIDILSIDGITIDDTGKDISKATCQYDNGGISNIKVTGATKYSWYNTGNNLVSSDLNLTGMPTGDYYLIAANDNGCSKQTATYTITREAPVSYSGVTKKLNDATCDENNGSIELIFEHAPAQLPESYKWVNPATGWAAITSTPIITGIDAGKYDIYATTNGCEQYIISYFIYRIPGLTVATNNVHVNDDRCSTGTGGIKGILAAGKTPLSFTWTDDNGINKGASPDLLNVTAGTYHLKVTDGSNCEQGFVYTVYNQSDALPSANVSDVQICSPGDVLLSVSNADSRYSYRLYEDNDGAAPIDEQQNGRFKVNVKANRSYYISQYFGNCESLRQEVKVVISGLSATDIANTFTPNGDGINDYWKIKGMENYTNGTVKVFSRDGKMVFQSKGYAMPFDGTLNGKPLPVGVYYYIIDLKTCDLLSGNLTILR